MPRFTLSTISALALLAACSAAASTESTVAQAPAITPAPIEAVIAAEAMAPPAAPAQTIAISAREDDSVSCDIRTTRTSNGVLIEGRAFADRDVFGDYALTIIKSGASSAELSQSGALDLEAGHAATLGQNEISIERGSRVRAVLTLSDDSGQICRDTLRL
mgnify:CR=1 FL=1